MWYYDTMEPEGGGQDKARGLAARKMYISWEKAYLAIKAEYAFYLHLL